MRRPDFFIVGAPKCGTTALSQYLGEHPSVFMSFPKEPHYFAEDMPKMRYVNNLNDYLKLFSNAGSDVARVGEASVWYLYSDAAIRNIFEFNPDSKIIVMLRNPVDMIYSMHSQAKMTLDEDIDDFRKAWDAREHRRAGRMIPKRCREPKNLQYGEIGKLGAQVERLLDVFPTKQVHFINFDDFRTKTRDCYESVLGFLQVQSDGRTEFQRINENKQHKLGVLAKFTQATPTTLVNLAMSVKRMLRIERLSVLDEIRSFNTDMSSRPPLDDVFRSELCAYFEADTRKLLGLVDEDTGVSVLNW